MKKTSCIWFLAVTLWVSAVVAMSSCAPKYAHLEEGQPIEAVACIACHKKVSPRYFRVWAEGPHARAGVTCLDCHRAEESDPEINQAHFKQYEREDLPYGKPEYKVPIRTLCASEVCVRCHSDKTNTLPRS
ncbi:MAG: hypothetical protein SVS15_07400 [Thermodesulfobacteriota bacterium]|nr:hypothetical protein [Thermodesulfobacteriota bacterium]